MASTSSSRITASPGADIYSYDVFLSFRGEDTRNSFTDHLYEALVRAGIHPFRDNDEIERGLELKPEIERAIRESRASIVVLSENYATSPWCLDELVLILEQKRERNHYVLPVFYHVDPSDVRKQNNTFKVEVKNSSRWTDENVSRWKEAVTKVANLTGLVLSGLETKFLKEVVNIIYDKLDHKDVHLPPNLVGMDAKEKEINIWLRKPSSAFLLICGMGGSGKTTLAKHIYNSHWKSFESASFVEDINTRCGGMLGHIQGLAEIRRQLLYDILGGKKRKIPCISQGSNIIEVLQKKKVFIVLDDIASYSDALALLGTGDLNAQSKIIITTREGIATKFNLSHTGCQWYDMKLLNDDESLELLRHHAFNSKTPIEYFEGLEMQAIRYCGGNPLALQVLGSSLSGSNDISYWGSHLTLLKKDMDSRIQSVLKRSYVSLPHKTQQELFLHIACFFIGKDIDYVVKILEPDYSAVSGIKTLMDRSLVSVLPNKKLMMHPLIQEMGRHIVREESFDHPEKRTRVFDPFEAEKIFGRRKGSKTMTGLAFDGLGLEYFKTPSGLKEFSTDSLKKMDKLKLLELIWVKLEGSYDNFSEDLRWISWRRFHLRTIPSDLFMGNLVALDMSYSKLEIFQPPMVLQSLRILNLSDTEDLIGIFNIYRLPSLDSLILWNCKRLVHICETIVRLENLALLNMTGCKNVCTKEENNMLVEKNSTSSGGFTEPLYSFSLPSSIQRLFLNNCNLEGTDSFPLSFIGQPNLQYVNLANSLFEHLPYYHHLQNLRVLDLSFCSRLKWLLRLPSTLAELYIYYCESLEKVTFESHRFTLQELGYEGCTNLSEIEGFIKLVPVARLDETDLGHLKWLKEYQNQEVPLVGDNEFVIGRSWLLQMLYEFDLMSISLPDIENPNLVPEYKSGSIGSSLCFNIPPCPMNKRLKGLNVTFKYTMSVSDDDQVWFAKIQTTNGVNLMYNPKVFGEPGIGKIGIWLSYWHIGSSLNVGDEVNVSIIVLCGSLMVRECGVTLVYNDDQVEDETFENNMWCVETLGEDLSGFQLSMGAYYLCRRDFFELMEVGRLTPGWFSILVGEAIDDTEVRGWGKTGRPKQLKQSYTELKTVRCILYGPGPEQMYEVARRSTTSFFKETMGFKQEPTSFPEKAATSSKLEIEKDATISEEQIYDVARGPTLSFFKETVEIRQEPTTSSTEKATTSSTLETEKYAAISEEQIYDIARRPTLSFFKETMEFGQEPTTSSTEKATTSSTLETEKYVTKSEEQIYDIARRPTTSFFKETMEFRQEPAASSSEKATTSSTLETEKYATISEGQIYEVARWPTTSFVKETMEFKQEPTTSFTEKATTSSTLETEKYATISEAEEMDMDMDTERSI